MIGFVHKHQHCCVRCSCNFYEI